MYLTSKAPFYANFYAPTLTTRAKVQHANPMPIELGINAKLADFNHFRGDHYRLTLAGGGYKPVSYPNGGMSGVRRLQHGLDRNTRSVFTKTFEAPDNFGYFKNLFVR